MTAEGEPAKRPRRSPSEPRPPSAARRKLIMQCAVRHCTRDGAACRCDRKPDYACFDAAQAWLTIVEQVAFNQAA